MSSESPACPGPVDADRVDRALLAVADHLEVLAAQRARLARAARDGWTGPHRQRFDAERATRDADLLLIAGRCRRLAVRAVGDPAPAGR